MTTIAIAIEDVVDQVHRAGQRAEDRERRDGDRHRERLEQAPAEDHAGQHEQVLGPLFGPERGEQWARYTLTEEKLRTASASLS